MKKLRIHLENSFLSLLNCIFFQNIFFEVKTFSRFFFPLSNLTQINTLGHILTENLLLPF